MKFTFTMVASLMSAATLRSAGAFAPLHVGAVSRSSTAGKISRSSLGIFDKLFSTGSETAGKSLPIVAEESVMSQKAHGTSEKPVQKDLRWNCDFETADRICNFNRHYAEFAGYWQTTSFLNSLKDPNLKLPIKFYDSVTGKLLFTAPVGRSLEDFLKESQKHGWPSFRDEEVNWDYVRCLRNGECISVSGTHLGHNIPDKKNRYCINLVSVAGVPEDGEED